MPWIWAALMPHPPVLVPEVGRGREQEAAATLDGLERLTGSIASRKPDRLLLLSPHQPYTPGGIFVNTAPRARGSLASFGAASAIFTPTLPEECPSLVSHLTENGFTVRSGEAPDLTADQGTMVPLFFLQKAWQKKSAGAEPTLPPTLLASPVGIDPASAFRLGKILASFDDALSWGLVASGDLSHRLTPYAPAGYSPAGKKFDEAAVEALSSGDPEKLLSLSPKEREEAGECGLRSVMTMLGLCREMEKRITVLSYEGPFGVGYCNALAAWDSE